jgi:hypothetical protein
MKTAHSLKSLRAASIAFLEDGGTMLHGVDGIIRDTQRLLTGLEQREKALLARESYIEELESKLLGLIDTLTARAAEPDEENEVSSTDSNATPVERFSVEQSPQEVEDAVESELSELREVAKSESTNSFSDRFDRNKLEKPLPSMLAGARRIRKNRRRGF